MIIPKWKPFPKTKPPRSGRYMVTIARRYLDFENRSVWAAMQWSAKYEKWNVGDKRDEPDVEVTGVVAWDYLLCISPYREGIAKGHKFVNGGLYT